MIFTTEQCSPTTSRAKLKHGGPEKWRSKRRHAIQVETSLIVYHVAHIKLTLVPSGTLCAFGSLEEDTSFASPGISNLGPSTPISRDCLSRLHDVTV